MSDFLDKVMTSAASGMSAQSERLDLIASNLANAGSSGSSDASTYHAKFPVFSEVTHPISGLLQEDQPLGGVRVTDVVTTGKPLETRYDPDNPMADSEGYVHLTDVNPIQQMTDMISASKEYEANVQVIKTTRKLMSDSIEALKT